MRRSTSFNLHPERLFYVVHGIRDTTGLPKSRPPRDRPLRPVVPEGKRRQVRSLLAGIAARCLAPDALSALVNEKMLPSREIASLAGSNEDRRRPIL